MLLSTFFRAITIIIFDISWVSILCFAILVPESLDEIVSKFFVKPSIHGIHHHAIDRDTNCNYSTIFSVWNRIFTTRNLLKLEAVNTLAIEGEKDQSLVQLLIRPFF